MCCDQVEDFLTCSLGRKGTKINPWAVHSSVHTSPRLQTATTYPLNRLPFTQLRWTFLKVKTAVEFIFIKDTSKISLHLWGSSSPPTPFPVERCFPALPVSSSGSGTATAWLRVDLWGLRLPGEMKEEAGAQEMQESPAGGTRALFATFSPDSVQIWGLINTTISDSWHTNLLNS